VPITDFHNLNWRISQLHDSIANSSNERLEKAEAIIKKAKSYEWVAAYFNSLVDKGLPTRVCHNDTKCENILLDQELNLFKHIIDLDTTGPGHVLCDFGDMMRTLLSPTTESETDLSIIEVNTEYLLALKDGFLEACQASLSPLEIDSLYFGGLYMTYMQAIRFLADYLNGDIYYKTYFPEENYIRAVNQFRLLDLLNEQIIL